MHCPHYTVLLVAKRAHSVVLQYSNKLYDIAFLDPFLSNQTHYPRMHCTNPEPTAPSSPRSSGEDMAQAYTETYCITAPSPTY